MPITIAVLVAKLARISRGNIVGCGAGEVGVVLGISNILRDLGPVEQSCLSSRALFGFKESSGLLLVSQAGWVVKKCPNRSRCWAQVLGKSGVKVARKVFIVWSGGIGIVGQDVVELFGSRAGGCAAIRCV